MVCLRNISVDILHKGDTDDDDDDDDNNNNNNNNNKPVLYQMHFVSLLWETEIYSRETGQVNIFVF